MSTPRRRPRPTATSWNSRPRRSPRLPRTRSRPDPQQRSTTIRALRGHTTLVPLCGANRVAVRVLAATTLGVAFRQAEGVAALIKHRQVGGQEALDVPAVVHHPLLVLRMSQDEIALLLDGGD